MGGRILVVDAGEEGRALLRALLTRLGHEAVVADDVRAALGLVDPEAPIDLMLLDLDSIEDWPDFAHRLRAGS
jgi:CheY-like chemotaxis protein